MRGWRTILGLGAALVMAGLASLPAHAVEPDEILPDPALEKRARVLSEELRCLVCQNQSIDDSSAPVARDIRLLVRERLKAGDSDAAVMKYLTDRYGNFILLRPPFEVSTLILWVLPFLMLATVGWLLWKRRVADGAAGSLPLSPDEERRLASLLTSTEMPSEPKA